MIINNIVYHEKFSYSSIIKDYLISDDLSEFLKLRIPMNIMKLTVEFILITQVYLKPNLFIKIYIKNKKWLIYKKLWKNHKKLKKFFNYNNNIKKNNLNDNNKYEFVFSTDVYNSIVKIREDLYNLLFGIEKNNYILEQKIKECNKLINEIEK